MIDAEFIDRIAELATSGKKIQTLSLADADPGYYIVADKDGGLTRHESPPPKQSRAFIDLDSLTRWGWTNDGRAAWVTLDGVTVTIGDARQSFGRVAYKQSPQYSALLGFFNSLAWLEQKQIVRLLRTTFAGCVSESLVAVFRTLKFVATENGQSSLQLTKANLGKSLEAEITGGGSIPDGITLTIPVLSDPFLGIDHKAVQCAVDVEVEAKRFAFLPLPLELERARRSTEIDLFNLVSDSIARTSDNKSPADFPIYMGSP